MGELRRQMMSEISRQAYADTAPVSPPAIKVRPRDTELRIEAEDDLTTHGEEVKSGGGKADPRRYGTGQMFPPGARICADQCPDRRLPGIVKADIGVKDGRIRHGQSRQPGYSTQRHDPGWRG